MKLFRQRHMLRCRRSSGRCAWGICADGLTHFHVGLADKIISGCEPAEVRHGLEVPNDDA